ncbi:MAG: hypothetical protein K2J30_01665, partial [Clostridia bacterium]|nr:hypothetical protein [Clostridia bacterium]
FDLTNTKWGYLNTAGKEVAYTEALEYKGSSYTMRLVFLPKGLTVDTYTDNAKMPVGKYTAKVVSVSGDDRFNLPPTSGDDVPELFEKGEWEICKKKVKADWKLDKMTSDKNVPYFLPTIKDASNASNVTIKYYYKDAENNDAKVYVDVKDIKVDPKNPVTYYAEMKIADSRTANYMLVNAAGTEIAESVQEFTPGEGKAIVEIEVSITDGGDGSYNGKPQLTVGATSDTPEMEDMSKYEVRVYKYTEEGDDDLSKNVKAENFLGIWGDDPTAADYYNPTEVGKYVIAVAFKVSEDYENDFALSSSISLFEIKQRDLSDLLSDVKWGYIDYERDPETGKIILDDNGVPKTTEKEYTGAIPYEVEVDKDGNPVI